MSFRLRAALGVLILSTQIGPALGNPLSAQSPRGGPRLADVIRPASAPFPASTEPDRARGKHPHSPSYWVEGGVFGAAFLGGLSYAFVHGLCETGDCTAASLEGAALGAVLGFGVGAMVGGQFPAAHPRPLKGHPEKGFLVGSGVGAMISFGLVSKGCLSGCSSSELAGDLLVTTGTGLVGFLLGLGTPEPKSP
ncbi:MAG TPA: hypothetical protein VJ992_12290 [Gemmatimonadales bacterium]|nr:hypothetical protein [Gemmatimonadales bacterium]